MPLTADPAEARRFLEQHPDVSAIELLIPDLNGVLRGKRIERDALLKVYTDGICLPGSLFGADITGETVEATGLGFEIGDTDQLCWPVSGTLCTVPWHDRPMAQLLMSMYELDGTPFYADPQHILRGVLTHFDALKLRPQVAVELEFYLIDQRRTPEGAPQPPLSPVTGEREHTTQVYGMNELDDYRRLFEEISDACSIQNIPAEAAVAEYAPGQYEVNLRYSARRPAGLPSRHPAETSYQGDRPALRHGSHLHGQALQRQQRQRHAHSYQHARRAGQQRVHRRHRNRQRNTASRHRRPVRDHGRKHGDLRTQRQFLPPFPAQQFCAAVTQLGLEQPHRRRTRAHRLA